jgi:hypothetical protein
LHYQRALSSSSSSRRRRRASSSFDYTALRTLIRSQFKIQEVREKRVDFVIKMIANICAARGWRGCRKRRRHWRGHLQFISCFIHTPNIFHSKHNKRREKRNFFFHFASSLASHFSSSHRRSAAAGDDRKRVEKQLALATNR